jgi:outer membrane receptor protein involved in Fe transport
MSVNRKRHATLASSVLALAAAAVSQPAAAQQAAAPQAEEENEGAIVVTGSRIDRPGYESPTPTLHVTADELNVVSRPNIGAALADLPQFKAGQSPQTSGSNAQAGRFPVDLRGLGATRSLLLIDGRRFSSDNDLNTIPSVLVKTVDIVTGGASAAWGSGAVAGVVNIIIDSKFTGLKLGAEAGISTYGDAGQRQVQGAFGTSFGGGRGHFVIGGEFLQNDGLIPKTSRPNTGRWVSLPNGDRSFTLTPNIGYSNATAGGYVLTGVLAGQTFNPDGTLRRADRGIVNGTSSIGGEMPSDDDVAPLITPQHRIAAMARASYELFDNLTVTADLRFSRYWDNYVWFGDHSRGNGITISRENAFLRPEIRQQLVDANQTSFTMGRFNTDLSYPKIDLERRTIQGTIAVDGSFSEGRWRYSAYYSHGEYQNNIDTPGFRMTTNFNNAVDSVISPTTGQPICRVALTNPGTNCVPINLFGSGSPSAAAIAYVTGTPMQRATTKLDTYGATLRGEPFELPAGAVSIAVGIEGRTETVNQRNGDLDKAGVFTTFSFGQLFGKDTVKEAFGEILVPVIKDVPLLRKLELNGAVRASDYRNSGTIWSWKVGATNEFLPGIIGRVTRSRDIRAPSLSELYATSTISYTNVPYTENGVSYNPRVLVNGGGNPGLVPEKADTLTAGVTMAPLPGLTASIDYYDIKIKGVIGAISAPDVVSRCAAGNAELCSRIFRDPDGVIERIVSTPVNLAEYKTNGIDGEIAYTMPVGAGSRMTFRAVGTWVNSLTTNDGISKLEYVGTTGYAFVNGMPDWRINASIGYSDPGLNAVIRARYISPGKYNGLQNITNNAIPAYTYVDAQLTFKIPSGNHGMEIYGSVTNLFNKAPPIASLYSPFYDVIGRYMSVGARVRF